MLNSILRACILQAVHAGSLYVNTTISVVSTLRLKSLLNLSCADCSNTSLKVWGEKISVTKFASKWTFFVKMRFLTLSLEAPSDQMLPSYKILFHKLTHVLQK